MAKIIFNLDELIGIIAANARLPGEILRLKAKGRKIHFVVKTGSFILPFVPASLSFSGFDGNNAVFDLAIAGSRLSKAKSWFDELLKPKLPACVQLDYPKLALDVNKLLAEKGVRGLRVKDMFFEGEELAVITGNTSSPN